MFCTQCGATLRETDRFCAQCGKPYNLPPGGLPPPPGLPLHRSLRRNMRERKIAGVCAGFADYFDMDVTLMRIIFLALLVTPPGVGLIGYLIAWVAMPKDTSMVAPVPVSTPAPTPAPAPAPNPAPPRTTAS